MVICSPLQVFRTEFKCNQAKTFVSLDYQNIGVGMFPLIANLPPFEIAKGTKIATSHLCGV